MKSTALFFALIFIVLSQAQNTTNNQKITLPNGWSLSPAGHSLPLGDLPLNIVVSPSKKFIAVTNNGQSIQNIQLINVNTEKEVDQITVPKSWLGLQFSKNEKFLYASGGYDNCIRIYEIKENLLIKSDSIALGKPYPSENICPTGLAIDSKRHRLYTVTKENNSLYILDLKTKLVIKQIPLTAEAYQCVLSPNGNQLYISLWGADQVGVFDIPSEKMTKLISVGDNPNDLLLTKNGETLYVTNGNDNTVAVINTEKKTVIETIQTSLYPNAPTGSNPNAIALSDDEKTLFIANADNNCVVVFDVSQAGGTKTKGFIPVGWYPTAIKVIGKKLYVANAKGFSSLPNPEGPKPMNSAEKNGVNHKNKNEKEIQYIGGLFKGTLSIIDIPNEEILKQYSKTVYQNTPYSKERELLSKGEEGNPIPQKVGDSSPIKHIFYIVKENRTYDQVLGDITEGNGDASLCLFPEKVTPNQHALVKDFVLLDNFYVDAEVSADGHNWSMAAYANDYVEKTWPTSYGSRGGKYEYEGTRKIAFPKDGFIWDHCKRAGISYRTYGEFADDGKPNIPALENHYCKKYSGYNLDVTDNSRLEAFKKDLDSLITINAVPKFNSMRFSNDHTYGARIGKMTPTAMIAENDLAVGKFVEYLSKSKIWNETALFILEDDAQNGSDHIDAHRSTAYVISPYTKRKTVIHDMYSTSSMLRTIELILGLNPMSQYDAAAPSMWNCFTKTPDFTTFEHKEAQVDITEKNIANTNSAKQSAKLNLAEADAAPDLEFNQIIWKTVRGENAEMPAPKHSAFLNVIKNDDKDDK